LANRSASGIMRRTWKADRMETEEHFLDFKCPFCGENVAYPQSAVGLVRECINCLAEFIVPEPGSETARTIPIPITADRLVLRRFVAEDLEALTALAADEEFFLHTEGSEADRERSVSQWLNRQRQFKLTGRQETLLAMVTRTGDKLIGFVSLGIYDEVQASLEIELHPSFQHQGFALEAVDGALGFCFEALKLHRVTAGCDSRNAAACRLFDRVGMRREGEAIKDSRLPDGSWGNTVTFAVLEEEYCKSEATPPAGGARE
jgi:RimJ/RimL family protein N-acetyltransferase/predicted RNA-binding Zn-ribbon protein involved in translation (DUF1610 family)